MAGFLFWLLSASPAQTSMSRRRSSSSMSPRHHDAAESGASGSIVLPGHDLQRAFLEQEREQQRQEKRRRAESVRQALAEVEQELQREVCEAHTALAHVKTQVEKNRSEPPGRSAPDPPTAQLPASMATAAASCPLPKAQLAAPAQMATAAASCPLPPPPLQKQPQQRPRANWHLQRGSRGKVGAQPIAASGGLVVKAAVPKAIVPKRLGSPALLVKGPVPLVAPPKPVLLAKAPVAPPLLLSANAVATLQSKSMPPAKRMPRMRVLAKGKHVPKGERVRPPNVNRPKSPLIPPKVPRNEWRAQARLVLLNSAERWRMAQEE